MARRSRSFTRPPPRTKMWIGTGVGTSTITANGNHFIGSLSAVALLLRPFTVLRTRLLVQYESDQAAVSETTFGVYGQIVVTDTATGIGVTAIPTPGGSFGDPDQDWFVFQPVISKFSFLTSAGFQNGGL